MLSLWLGSKEGLVLKLELERRRRAKTQSGQCDEKEVATQWLLPLLIRPLIRRKAARVFLEMRCDLIVDGRLDASCFFLPASRNLTR